MQNLRKDTGSVKSAFIWNTVGSMFNAASSLIYMLIVTRILGAYDAGIFAIAFANAQLMLTIGRYGMRTFQATDLNGQFSFQTYLTSRIITCAAMLLSSVGYIVISGYSQQKAVIVLWVCLLKMVDAVEDVFHGLLQKNEHLDTAGKLLSIRNIFSMVIFLVVLVATRQLLFTCVLTAVISFALCLLINIPYAVMYDKIQLNGAFVPLKQLLLECFPLFAGSFLSLYIYNAPKYAIDSYLTSDIQTYYGILFMPAFIVNLFSEFVFKPLLTTLTELWLKRKKKEFLGRIMSLFKWIILFTAAAIIGGYFAGIQILSLIYGINLSLYKMEFMVLLLGGGFGAAVWLLNNVLTVMRKQRELLIGYLAISIFASIISPLLVQKMQLSGAAGAYMCSIALLCVFFIGVLLFYINQKDEKSGKES